MEGKYGENKKKIVFFDTDERHKELKIMLDRYGLTQSKLFRYLVTCMLEENQISKDIIRMIDDNSNKKSRKRSLPLGLIFLDKTPKTFSNLRIVLILLFFLKTPFSTSSHMNLLSCNKKIRFFFKFAISKVETIES